MKILKILTCSSLFFVLLGSPFLGCGSNTQGPDSAAGGSSGSGGTLPYDAAAGGVVSAGGSISPIDSGVAPTGGIGGGTCDTPIDCTGLTPAQCHDRILNPPCVPDGVLPQEAGLDPTVPYPNCSAI
jgi:hypothetical protein